MAKNKNQKQTAPVSQKSHSNKTLRNVILTILGTALVATGVVFVLKLTAPSKSDDQPEDNTAPTPETTKKEEKPKDEDKKEETADATNATTSTETPKTPSQYEGTNPNTLNNLTGSISFSSIVDDKYQFRVNIDQSLQSAGTCLLEITSSAGTAYTQTVSTITGPSTSSCDNLDVPLAQLHSGAYDVTITISADNKTGILKSDITIP